MAQALIEGLLSKDTLRADQIIASDIDDKRLAQISRAYGIETTSDNIIAAERSQYVLLAVKPQHIDVVLVNLKNHLSVEKTVISIAAGVERLRIQALLELDLPVVRVMPNAPALVNAGVSAVALPPDLEEDQKTFIHKLWASVGEVVYVDEEDINAVTAVSGSGPAYFYLFVRELARAGVEAGLTEETARVLARQTFYGSAALLKESGRSEDELISLVTSPGGTTESALQVFDALGFGETIKKAVKQALSRAKELADS